MEIESTSSRFIPEGFEGTANDIAAQFGFIFQMLKAPLFIPILNIMVFLCLAMSLMLFIERLYMGVVIVLVKIFGKKIDKRYKYQPIRDDIELGSSAYPMVLIQIPMFNEKEVYQLSIGAACGLSWPADRIIIQVLDDSTDPAIKDLVELECKRWQSKGINIIYEIRDNRLGPISMRTTLSITDVNSDECLMTRMQEMSLDYHFTVEQEVGSSTYAFFGFNGTAGVWRISAIEEAGGWNGRTTVEDMDLAVRAGLKGFKFLYIGDLHVKSELPSTFKAYRFQQHRWSCGPANLFRKMVMEIVRNKKVTLWKKFYVIYSFFFVRKIIAHIVTFVFYCIVIPGTVLVPEVHIPMWGLVYIPSIITILNAVGTPRSVHLLVFWILFENVMSLHRSKACFIGLFETGRVNEWVVTDKLGDVTKATKPGPKATKKPRFSKIGERLHLTELGVGAFLFFVACYDYSYGKNNYWVYLYFQAVAFFVMGFGYVGTFVPNS
ncbi:hypothetical protein C5167_033827 [Papaver somniferum]|uniref:Glycosyltransferase 2-like domain-containing protein n=1 Tax=Papaver somniferum TaxID=3469 RepID=A0A4Y7KB92_PAPSO|nr:hypothetical protein C5167_033827 [Papaver somniferum]